MLASISRKAEGLPDISRPTSKPSAMPSLFCTSESLSCRASTASVTPIFRASSRDRDSRRLRQQIAHRHGAPPPPPSGRWGPRRSLTRPRPALERITQYDRRSRKDRKLPRYPEPPRDDGARYSSSAGQCIGQRPPDG